jgi:hypothetical protein
MTTIPATDHRRTTLIAALAAGTAFVAGATLGLAWDHQNVAPSHHDTRAAEHSLQVTTKPVDAGGVTTAEEMSGTVTGHMPATGSPGGATTAEEMSGTVT